MNDDVLKQACTIIMEQEITYLDSISIEPQHKFSKSFEKKMSRLIKSIGRRKSDKMLCILLVIAVFAAAGAVCMSIKSIRTPFLDFLNNFINKNAYTQIISPISNDDLKLYEIKRFFLSASVNEGISNESSIKYVDLSEYVL